MSELAPTRQYRLTRPGGLGFIRRRSAGQFAICCAGILCGLLALVLGGLGPGGRTGLGVGAGLLIALGATRLPGGEDLVDLVGPGARLAHRRLTGRNRWSSFLTPFEVAELPPAFSGIRLYDYDARHALGRAGAEHCGIITDRADGSITVVLRVHGEGFLLADPAEQDERLTAFGEALASTARAESPVVRVAWSQFVAPAPLSGHLSYLAATRREDADPAIAASYAELLRDTAAEAVASEVLISVSASLARVRTGRGEDRLTAGIESLLTETDLLVTSLARAGLGAIGPLPAGRIARTLRARLDPVAERQLEARSRSLGEVAGLLTPENGFPLHLEEHRRELLVDGSWHRLYRVAEWPRSPVRADWLAGFLCARDATRSCTVVFSPVAREAARRQALGAATRVGASIEERELHGRRVGAEEQRARLAADALDEELAAGASLEVVAGLVDVTGATTGELEEACERTCLSAASAGVELRCLGLRQAAALVAALPLGRTVLGRPR